MTSDLSVIGLLLQASIPVKIVMIQHSRQDRNDPADSRVPGFVDHHIYEAPADPAYAGGLRRLRSLVLVGR
jgi:hypothetical protein